MGNPRLIFIHGPAAPLVVPITRESSITLGRGRDNTISILDPTLSANHCAFAFEGDTVVMVNNVENTNGTFIDGDAYSQKEMAHDDRIEAGMSVIIFADGPHPVDAFADLEAQMEEEKLRAQKLATWRKDQTMRADAALYYKDVLRAFRKMAAALKSVADRDELLRQLLGFTLDIIPARRAAILLNGAHLGFDAADLIAQYFHEREPGNVPFGLAHLNGSALEEVYRKGSAFMTLRPVPIIGQPILLGTSLKGVLYLEGNAFESRFEPEHLQFAEHIADMAAAALSAAGEFQAVRNQRDTFKAQVEATADREIIGKSPALLKALEMAAIAAASDIPVLIQGETGTGKEAVAHHIHNRSRRVENCFVPVNCPATPEHLFEAEMFGHTKGAFTGATEAREGHFKRADGGTLFFDEIGELDLAMQKKLLRPLQEGEVQGPGEAAPTKVDVRVVAATNVDLAKAVEDGSFREDLFYRLRGMVIHLPPLRERREDIPLLVEYFVDKWGKGTSVRGVSAEAMAALEAYRWPGNIRELDQIIRSAVALASYDGMRQIEPQQLPLNLTQPKPASEPVTFKAKTVRAAANYRRQTAAQMLKQCGGDKKRAAEQLKISVRRLEQIIEED